MHFLFPNRNHASDTADSGPTMTSITPDSAHPHRFLQKIPTHVLEELRKIYPPAPEDQYVSVGKCATSGKEITLCYNTFGDPSDPCMLLIMGLNSPAPYWDTRFCVYLASCGFYVIRYDNRDVGLSTHFSGYAAPHILRLALPAWASVGEPPLPYTLEDMADDAVKLLRALQIRKAHIVGCSMGGMIAQHIVLRNPEVVASLCLHSTSAGVAWPKPSVILNLLDRPESAKDVQSVLNYRVRFFRALSGDMPFHEEEFRMGMWYDWARSDYQAGGARHLAAIARSADRTAALRARVNPKNEADAKAHPYASVSSPVSPSSPATPGASVHIPVLVLHGGKDPIIPVENGKHLAECIHGAKLVIYPHMGHYFPREAFKPLADEMVLNARSAPPPVE